MRRWGRTLLVAGGAAAVMTLLGLDGVVALIVAGSGAAAWLGRSGPGEDGSSDSAGGDDSGGGDGGSE